MNTALLVLLSAGYGYLAGNPKARKDFLNGVSGLAGKGIDTLNNMGGDGNNVSNVQPSTNEREG